VPGILSPAPTHLLQLHLHLSFLTLVSVVNARARAHTHTHTHTHKTEFHLLDFPLLFLQSFRSLIFLNCLLIPWCRILFEKLIVTQLVKKYPAFLWNPKVHYRVHTSPPLDPIMNQLNPVRPIDPYLSKVHLNVILPPKPRSSQWSLTFGPPNQNPVNTSPLLHACHMSHPPHPS
jgi:hypothetical protein